MILTRLRFVTWVFAALYLVVVGRLVHLQFVAREFWDNEALNARTDEESVPFRRGSILDRWGNPLAVGEIDQTLYLVFGEFRKKTALGQAFAALRMLSEDGGRKYAPPTLRQILAAKSAWMERLLAETPQSIDLLPRRARDDYGFYLRGLLGLTETDLRRLRERLKPDQPYRELLPDVKAHAVEAIASHEAALKDLADAIEQPLDDLLAAMEGRIEEIDRALSRAAAGSEASPDARQMLTWKRDYESRRMMLVRGVPYRAVYYLNMVPGRFDGIEVHDVDSRRYADAYATISPLLIGWVGDSTPELLEDTTRDRLRFRELESQPAGLVDDNAASEIDRLRDKLRKSDYLADEQLGKYGLEALLEPVLRGQRGWRNVEHDRSGADVQLLYQYAPVDGQDVKLTLDADLQLAAERVLEKRNHPGAIVLIDPRDGAIRALASFPNPTRQQIKEDYGDLLKDKRHPLFNRCYRSPGNPPPPGSVFKLIVATAGLEAGLLSEGTVEECGKYLQVGAKRLSCLGLHGDIDLVTALQKSCNIFFYKVAGTIGLERIEDMAARFGVGVESGFGSPQFLGIEGNAQSLGEMAFPPADGRVKLFVMQTAIGHAAYDDITPLQVATLVAPFANGGDRVRPWLVDTIGGKPAKRTPPAHIGLKDSTLATIRLAMQRVCEPGGTANPSVEEGIDLRKFKVAGKTGTPQQEVSGSGGKMIIHAWFAGFFPFDAPKLAFAVYVEDSEEHGGHACKPILWDLLNQPEMEPYR